MRVLETDRGSTQSPWFVLEDIDARARAAYDKFQSFFDDRLHRVRCDQVEAILRKHARTWNAIYHTSRDSRSRGPNTEVKFNRVEFARGKLASAAAEIEALGIDGNDIVYKPRSISLSVHVR